jgi:hypothetical protein
MGGAYACACTGVAPMHPYIYGCASGYMVAPMHPSIYGCASGYMVAPMYPYIHGCASGYMVAPMHPYSACTRPRSAACKRPRSFVRAGRRRSYSSTTQYDSYSHLIYIYIYIYIYMAATAIFLYGSYSYLLAVASLSVTAGGAAGTSRHRGSTYRSTHVDTVAAQHEIDLCA